MAKGIKVSEKHGVNPSVTKCFWCGEDTGVALLGKLKEDEEAPREIVTDYNFCDKCIENIGDGIALIEVSTEPMQEGQPPIQTQQDVYLYPTGTWIAVTKDAIRKSFDPENAETFLKYGKGLLPVGIIAHLLGHAEDNEGDD